MSKSTKKASGKPQSGNSSSSSERKPVLSIIKDIQSVRRRGSDPPSILGRRKNRHGAPRGLFWRACRVSSLWQKYVDAKALILMFIIDGSDCRSSKEFLEAGKKRLAGDTTREATAPEVSSMKSENEALKQLVAELSLENRLLKKGGPPPRLKADE